MNEIFVEHYFPTHIFFTEHPDSSSLNKQLEKDIYAWSEKEKSMERSNAGGWHSPTNMHELPQFKEISDWISKQVNRVKTDGLFLKEETDLLLDNMWANINKRWDYNVKHAHPHSNISGVYYVTVPEPKAKIWFHDPVHSRYMIELHHDDEKTKNMPEFWSNVHYEPVPGKLILFPSYLEHTVEQNLSNENRISISFNFVQADINKLINFKYP